MASKVKNKKYTATILKKLFQQAKIARNQAYSPYSKIKVGAALLADNNKIFSGCNIENISYGATICAERVAISNAILSGCKKIKCILIITKSKEPWPPCGICKQVIAEFASKDCHIILANLNNKITNIPFSEISPFEFSIKKFSIK